MIRSLSQTARPAAAFVALAWTALTFGATLTATPAQAGEGPFYRAELAAPAQPGKTVASGQVWNCTDTACVAGKGTSRPAIVCARLVKQVGPVASFVANGKALEADALAKCNGQ